MLTGHLYRIMTCMSFFNVIIICTDFSAFINNYKRKTNSKEFITDFFLFHYPKIVGTIFNALLSRFVTLMIGMLKVHVNSMIKDCLKF